MNDVKFVSIEIAIKIYECRDLLDFFKPIIKVPLISHLIYKKRFLTEFVRTLIKDCVENSFSKNLENKSAFTISIPELYFLFCPYFKWEFGPNQAMENGPNCQGQFVLLHG